MAEATAAGTDLVSLTDQQVEAALKGELDEVTLKIEDPQVIQHQIIERILASADAEQVLAGRGKALHGREALDRPFTLHGVRWLKSRFKEGLPVFAVLEATMLDDGESVVITSSAGSVMAQAFALHRLGSFPVDVKLTEADQETAAGFRPQWLEAAAAA